MQLASRKFASATFPPQNDVNTKEHEERSEVRIKMAKSANRVTPCISKKTCIIGGNNTSNFYDSSNEDDSSNGLSKNKGMHKLKKIRTLQLRNHKIKNMRLTNLHNIKAGQESPENNVSNMHKKLRK